MTGLNAVDAEALPGEQDPLAAKEKMAAQVNALHAPRQPIRLEDLKAMTVTMPRQQEGSGSLIRAMRDSDRY